jgi:hypothetical protein
VYGTIEAVENHCTDYPNELALKGGVNARHGGFWVKAVATNWPAAKMMAALVARMPEMKAMITV